MAGLDEWLVDDMVRFLTANPNACAILSPNVAQAGTPRIRRDGHRIHLVRHLSERLTGEELDPKIALVPGGCPTAGCLNPAHRVPSRRRTLPKRRSEDA